VDETCEYCTARKIEDPCIKLLGPKSQSRRPFRIANLVDFSNQLPNLLDTSRIVTEYDPSITPEESHLLNQLFERTQNVQARIVDGYKFSVLLESIRIYGPSIRHPSLRPALCALFQPEANPADFTSLARQSLISRMHDRTKLDVGDLLASFLLFLSTFHPQERLRIWSVYWKGTLSIAYWLWSSNDPSISVSAPSFSGLHISMCYGELVICIRTPDVHSIPEVFPSKSSCGIPCY
jgi:hypothetical protein